MGGLLCWQIQILKVGKLKLTEITDKENLGSEYILLLNYK